MYIYIYELLQLSSTRFLMKHDFVRRIERAQMDQTSHLDTCVSGKTAPFKIITGVMPVTTSPMPKLE